MISTPRFFIFYDRDGIPIKYEAGYFSSEISGPSVFECSTEEILKQALDGHVEYTGYTSHVGTSENMLSELLGNSDSNIALANELRTMINLAAQLTARSAMTATNAVPATAQAASRELSCTYLSQMVGLLDAREWEVGMTTQPGELVYNPDKTFIFAYAGATPYKHANSTFYPGSSGVYYWSILPEIYEEVKVYPDIPGIIVSVKQNEIWWDKNKNEKYCWVGVDNANCSWEPQPGNEWKKVV